MVISNIFGINPETRPSYPTRQTAISNGHLVDLHEHHSKLMRELGFSLPVAMTFNAYWRYVELNSMAIQMGEDTTSRLYAILHGLGKAIRESRSQGRFINRYTVSFYAVLPEIPKALRCTVEAVVEKGDQGEPVLTIRS